MPRRFETGGCAGRTQPIGLATGDVAWVLDVDPRHHGDDALVALEHKRGVLPDTPRVLTGGGGSHLYFARNPTVTTTRGSLPSGLDVRGHGGYVILPPSVHPGGGTYRWEIGAGPAECALLPAPTWLVMMITSSTRDRLRRDGTALAIPEGERNVTIFKLGCMLRRYGLSGAALAASLQAINEEHATPPLPALMVERIAIGIARRYPTSNQ